MRQQQIDEIIEAYRHNTESNSVEQLIAAYPELMPELGEQLTVLRLILAAEKSVELSDGLEVRCPHCHQPIVVTDDFSISELTCSACDSRFGLVDDSTVVTHEDSFMLGRFHLTERIGEGAFGCVWIARDTQLDREVAIKIPRGIRLTSVDADRFFREARTAAQLTHPNIVQVHEVGRDADRIFIVSEYVEGANLAEWLELHRPTPTETASICSTIADAIQHAHQCGVIHRDLKPSNVLMGMDGEPYVMDFGLAKRYVGEVTMTLEGRLLGTPAYMSPEQARGLAHDADPRTDVYSIGVILYELLTGERPFRGTTPMLVHQILFEEAVRPRRFNNLIPRDLETICLKCLEKDAHLRYQSANDLRDDLLRFQQNQPVQARAVSPLGIAHRWCNRNRPLAVSLIALVLVTLVGFFGVTAQWLAAESQRKLALHTAEEAQDERADARWQSYRANIAAASSAFQLHNVAMLRRALQDAPSEYRGWEWQHLDSQLDHSLAVLPAFNIWSNLGFSSDGTRLFFAHASSPHGWDVATLKPITNSFPIPSFFTADFRYRLERDQPSGAVASPDGRCIAKLSDDGALRLFDASSNREIAVLRRDIQPLVLPTFSPDSGHVASWCGDGNVRIWGTARGLEEATLRGEPDTITSLMFSPDASRVITWTIENETNSRLLWDATNGKLIANLQQGGRNVAEIAFNPSGSVLATGEDFPWNSIGLWNPQTGERTATLQGHKNRVATLAFHPEGTFLASGSLDETARLWELGNGGASVTLRGHKGHVHSVRFSPDGLRLLSAGADGSIRSWEVPTGDLASVLLGHAKGVYDVEFSPDGSFIASAANDNSVRLWDSTDRHVIRGHSDMVYDVAYCPDGSRIASASWDKTLRIWNAHTGRQEQMFQSDGGGLVGVTFSPDGKLMACTSRTDEKLYLWDLSTNKLRHKLPLPIDLLFGQTSIGAAFNRDSSRIIAGTEHGTIRIFDTETGVLVAELEGASSSDVGGCITDVTYSPDWTRFVSVGGRAIQIWNASTNEIEATLLGHLDNILAVTMSRESTLIASSSFDQTVRLWDVDAQKEVAVLNHGCRVYSMSFSPDGTRLATACENNTVRLWDVARREEVAALHGHDAYVHGVDFSPDGTQLVSCSGDHNVRFWDTLSILRRAQP